MAGVDRRVACRKKSSQAIQKNGGGAVWTIVLNVSRHGLPSCRSVRRIPPNLKTCGYVGDEGRLTGAEFMVPLSKGAPAYEACGPLVKGPEIALPAKGGSFAYRFDGESELQAPRLRWVS
jgi:hypothetical protein